jgi:hypothetical protein
MVKIEYWNVGVSFPLGRRGSKLQLRFIFIISISTTYKGTNMLDTFNLSHLYMLI